MKKNPDFIKTHLLRCFIRERFSASSEPFQVAPAMVWHVGVERHKHLL